MFSEMGRPIASATVFLNNSQILALGSTPVQVVSSDDVPNFLRFPKRVPVPFMILGKTFVPNGNTYTGFTNLSLFTGSDLSGTKYSFTATYFTADAFFSQLLTPSGSFGSVDLLDNALVLSAFPDTPADADPDNTLELTIYYALAELV